jgi:hypothetical protein
VLSSQNEVRSAHEGGRGAFKRRSHRRRNLPGDASSGRLVSAAVDRRLHWKHEVVTRTLAVGYIVMRLATSYLVTDARRPGVSPAGIAFSASSPRL